MIDIRIQLKATYRHSARIKEISMR